MYYSFCTIATSDVSSAEDYSTCSYTGDSGFSDSRVFMKQSPVSPPSPSEPAQHQGEQGSDKPYASLNTADVRTGYYKSLNPETRIPGIMCFLIRVIRYLYETIICISDVIYDKRMQVVNHPCSDNK